jgi:hypothetical protein
MDFSQALSRFVGRRVESFQTAQLVAGILAGVGAVFYTIQVSAAAYTSAAQVTVLDANTEFVRILPE